MAKPFSLLLLVLLLLLAGCSRTSISHEEARRKWDRLSTLSADKRTDFWCSDLDRYAAFLENNHPDLYRLQSREEFHAALNRLKEAIPARSDEEIFLELKKITAAVGDGHTDLFAYFSRHLFPLMLDDIGGKVYIVLAEDESLPGGELTGVAGHPLKEVLERIAPCVSRDNERDLWSKSRDMIPDGEILHALGLVPSPDETSFRFKMPDDSEKEVLLHSYDPERDKRRLYGLQEMPESKRYFSKKVLP